MRLSLILFLIFISVADCFCQKRNSVWCFGDSCGLDFNSGVPIPFTSTISSMEEAATISDNNGNLLFYVGDTCLMSCVAIKNRLHETMQNGDSLLTSGTMTNGVIIIPFPSDPSKYYIFQIAHLRYSIVDMSLASGLGAVTQKNVLLSNSNFTESLAAVRHGNGRDWWLIGHLTNNNIFYKYLITPLGITGPYIQNIGTSIVTLMPNGEMEFSFKGDKMVVVCPFISLIDLYSFDRCSGLLYNWQSISPPTIPYPASGYYGCCFSPSGEVLYVTVVFPPYSTLLQFNLNAANIASSAQTIYSNTNGNVAFGQLQLGPDNKIYLANDYPNYLPNSVYDSLNMYMGVVNTPDSLGTTCNFAPYSLWLGGHKTIYGLPNNPNYELGLLIGSSCDSLRPAVNFTTADTSFCEKNCIDFFDFSSNNPTSWQWFFPGADSTTSMLQNPTNICYNSYGSFDVTLIACNSVGCDTLVLPGFINEYPLPVPVITQSNDTLFSSPGVAYQWWSVDSGIIAGANNSYYIPTQNGNYYVIVTDSIGCVAASNVLTNTGISTLFQQRIEVSPNPFTNNLIVKLNSNETSQIIIYDITSRKLLTQQFRYTVTINTEQLAKGVYIYELRNKNVVIKKGKVVKE